MSNNKTQAITYFNDAMKLYNIKLYDEALELYKKSIDIDMTFADAHFCLAKTYIRKKEYDQGTAHFQKFYHLIAESKQGKYVLALSNILIEEKQSKKALKLTKDLNVHFSEQQVFDYIPLLLANNRENQAIHSVLQLNDVNKVSKGYKLFLKNESLDKSIIGKLASENIIPRFYASKSRLKELSTAGIQHKEFASKIQESQELINIIPKEKQTNYQSNITKIESNISEIQKILATQTETVLKTDNLEYSKKLIGILESTKYTPENLKPLILNQTNKEKAKNKKITKITILVIAVIIIACLGSYFGYNLYQKSSAYERALSSESIQQYTSYIDKYGDDEKLHSLREEQLYQKSIETNNAEYFNQLSSLYPNSKKLRTIDITIDGDTDGVVCFGTGNENEEINKLSNAIIRVPVGSKIVYKIHKSEKHNIDKSFTIVDDLSISESTIDLEEEIFNDDFDDNRNNWELINKEIGGSTVYKIVIENGTLFIVNGRGQSSLTALLNKNILGSSDDYEIITRIIANRYSSNGFYVLYDAKISAFSFIGYAGKTNSSNYNFGHNNWDDSRNSWKSYIGGWKNYNHSDESAILKLKKQNGKLYYSINGNQVAESWIKKKYGNKIGFHSTGGTKTRVDYIIVNKLNKPSKTTFISNNTYFCYVNELNVRDIGNGKGKIITTIKVGDPIKYLGEKGNKKINATFKEIFSPNYYYKVELIDGTIGWVHGGAIKTIPSEQLIKFNSFKSIIK